ncbi:sigma factor-like helix-turn-helix DNA-binding protein [Streptomyces sp. NPDC056061]|uniref:sigma factor-like helix-turn-helix DNA-binding protein n=1 Tax=Streptomyces sp. NPDC056061 TaxID=3345700 RepID=UPI0035DE37D2
MTAAPRSARPGHGPTAAGSPLPLAYKAFCLRNENRYVQYARARSLEPGRARAVVEAVLQVLVERWPRIISGDRPACEAWGVLVSHVGAAARDLQAADHGHARDAVHKTLPCRQADIVLLRYRLSLSTAETADLMGLGVAEVTASLRRGLSILLNPA